MNRHQLVLTGLLGLAAGALIGWRTLIPTRAEPPSVENPLLMVSAPPVEAPKVPAGVEAGIKTITEEYAKAFNAGDAKAASELWTAEGEYTGPDGEAIRGRAAIEKSLAGHFKASPKAVAKIRVESVRIIGRQTALAEGVVELTAPGSVAVNETRYSALHVVEDGQWLAASVREWIPDPEQGAARKHLDWLIGEWTATGTAGTITMSYAWDETKTFLHGKYAVTKDAKIASSGSQVLALNPAGGLRSWTFDSGGTFCNAFRAREGNQWVESVTGVSPGGMEITAVNVLIPLGSDSFTWQTTERTADNVPLPALPPLKIARSKPGK
jgi:uncharacterized protein (TIGR02246 family)